MKFTRAFVTVTPANALNPQSRAAAQGHGGWVEHEAEAAAELPRRRAAAASVAHGALALLSAQPVTWAATIVATIFLPHYLGPARYGTLAITQNLSALLVTIVSLGLSSYVTRFIATQPRKSEAAVAGSLALVLSVALPIALGFAILAPVLRLPIPTSVLRVALVGMVIIASINLLNAGMIGNGQHGRYAWLNAGWAAAQVAAGITVLARGADLTMYVATCACVSAVVLIFMVRASGLRPRHLAFDPRLAKQLVHGGLPFLTWNIATQVRNQVDLVLVGLLLGQQAAGWLAAAYRIITIPTFIPTLIMTPLLPALSRVRGEEGTFRQILRRSLNCVLILTIPCSAGIIGLAPAIPGMFHWPAGFSNSIPLMMVLAVQQPLMAVDMILGTALLALNQERRWLRITIIAALFNPAANLLAIPVFASWFSNGALAATLVEVTTELLMLAGALVLLPAGTLGRGALGFAGRALLAGLAVVVVASATRDRSIPLSILAGAATYVASAAMLRVLRLADVQELINLVRQSRAPKIIGSGN